MATGTFGKWAADLLARVGTFTGTGVNTVLGFLRAMMRKDLAAPSDAGGTYLPSTDSLEAQSERLAGFVSSAVVTFISALAGGLVTIYRDCDLQINFTGLGPIALSDQIYFTVKFAGKLINLDSDAVLLVKRTTGLVYLCKHFPITAGNGSLTVTDAVLGNVTVCVKVIENAKLPITADLVWDVKRITAGGAVDPPLSNGTAQVLATATRSVA